LILIKINIPEILITEYIRGSFKIEEGIPCTAHEFIF